MMNSKINRNNKKETSLQLFNIENKFKDIITSLQKGNRPLFKFSEEDLLSFQTQFQNFIDERNIDEIKKCLCLLDHCQNYDEIWKEILIGVIKINEDELTILALGTSHRHLIDFYQRKGHRISFDFLKLLEELLGSKNPEILEWALRTIEALGSQSLFFKQKVLASRPSIFKRLRPKWKNSIELINFLENKWKI